MTVRWFSRRPPAPDASDVAHVARQLLRLDPWAFWSVELGGDDAASFAVLGRTGAFVVAASPLDGYLVAEGRELLVDGTRVEGWRAFAASARTLRGRVAEVGAPVEVSPILVLTRAVAGAPRTHRGVRVLRPDGVVPDIVGRPHVLDPSTAQRVASKLGRVLRGPGAAEPDDPQP